jgi:hypothetical protein
MSEISVQELKARLSGAIAEAEAGRMAAVRRGSRVGRGRLVPALKTGTRGRALAALLEDRGDR